ncbi:unnamed protein product [Sphagnum balticum]
MVLTQVDMEGVVLPLVLADNLMGVLHQAIATNVDKVVSVKEEVKVGDYGGSSSDGDGSQGEEVVIGAFTE